MRKNNRFEEKQFQSSLLCYERGIESLLMHTYIILFKE